MAKNQIMEIRTTTLLFHIYTGNDRLVLLFESGYDKHGTY